MTEYQLFLLAVVFAARRDADHLAKLLPCFGKQKELLDAVGVFWPELDNPDCLRFLFNVNPNSNVDCEAVLVQLIDSDDNLIPIVEMEHDILLERCRATKNYVESRLNEIPECKTFKFGSFEAKWMRRRMILCNRLTPNKTTSYRQLWDVANSDVSFNRWIEGIVEPLEHINRRLHRALTIEAFEAMEPMKVFELAMKTDLDYPSTVIHREVIPYLKSRNLHDDFLESIFTESYFPLDSTGNVRNFSYLYEELCTISPDPVTSRRVQSQAAQVIFNNSSSLLKVSSVSKVRELLSKIDDNVKVGSYDITVASLKHYTKCLESVYKTYTLQDIYAISREETLGQLAHFATIVREEIMRYNDTTQTVEIISQLMDVSTCEEERVFKNLTIDQKTSVFLETVLELGKFELLEKFLTKFVCEVDEDVLVKYFWHFYNKASNGLKSRPEIKNARQILDLLLKSDEIKYKHLNALLDAVNDLSTYSLNLGKGIPFKPSDVLSFSSKIFDLISLLLELNPTLYKDMSATLRITENLQEGLQLKRLENESTSETIAKVLALHVDYSLVNLDFHYALDGTKELLGMENVSSFWPTIFQVGKFIDPRWPDGEAPVDILVSQLELLGDLLGLCPLEEVEAIVSQWSATELEVVTRDPAFASFDVKGTEALTALFTG